MAKQKSAETNQYILAIIAIVAIVGIVLLMGNSGSSSLSLGSNDISGQAISVSKTVAVQSTLLSIDTDKDGYPDYYEGLTGTDKKDKSSYTSCYDTDSPEDNSKKGTMYRYKDDIMYSYEDYCLGDNTIVDTYSCGTTEQTFKTQTYDCPSGKLCSDGACVSSTKKSSTKKISTTESVKAITECEDEDNLDSNKKSNYPEFREKNSATKGVTSITDSCKDKDIITEAVCQENALSSAYVSCSGLFGSEYSCTNGACVMGS
ncbi:MAG: hypothetical protein AABX98_00850 [Nanoarchaeota archaeon]